MKLRNSTRLSSVEVPKEPAAKKAKKSETPKKSPTKSSLRKKKRISQNVSKTSDNTKEMDQEQEEEPSFYISTEPEEMRENEVDETNPDSDDEDEGGKSNDIFFISTEPTNPEEEENNPDSAEENDIEDEEEDKEEEEDEKKSMFLGDEELKKFEKKERFLESFLFGPDFNSKVRTIEKDEKEDSHEEEIGEDEEGDGDKERKKKKRKNKEKFQPLWEDDEDESVLVKDVAKTYSKAKGKHGDKEMSEEKYSKFLKRKYVSFVGTPKWAEIGHEPVREEDSDDEFFRETTDMMEKGRKESLDKGFLEYRKLKDINYETHSEGTVIKAAEFHPRATVSLVAGLNGTASLFQVDGKLNPKIQTINFENFPIRTAHFSSDGNEFLVGSQHFDHFIAYDMIKGKTSKIRLGKKLEQGSMQRFEVSPNGDYIAVLGRFGHTHFLNARTKDFTFSVKMNDDVTAVAFSPDGREVYSHGAGGEVYIWDVRSTRSCTHRFVDDGSVRGTTVAVSPNNRFVACGSNSGVVNIYQRQDLTVSKSPKPLKIILNLTTEVHHLKFNPTSEVLALASEAKENAMKLVHVPSLTVFQNFPSFNFNLKRVNCLDFSLNGGYMSVGNNRGAANLYRLKHYGSF